jgi:outer membrane protein OmpA-like peptidoglycan-associated protein
MRRWAFGIPSILVVACRHAPAPAVDRGADRGSDRGEDAGAADRNCVLVRPTADCILEPIYFGSGSTSIDPAETPILDEIATAMRAMPELEVVALAGHHAAGESAAFGDARARAVVTTLIARGVAPARLVAIDAGAGDPLAAPALARRVDYEIRRQRVDPAVADEVTCTPVGAVGAVLAPEVRRARCR